MKTSVAIVRSTLQLSLESDRTAVEYREEPRKASANTNPLHMLVRSMLDLVRVEGAASLLSTKRRTCAKFMQKVQEVLRRLTPIAEQAGIEIVVSVIPAEH